MKIKKNDQNKTLNSKYLKIGQTAS